MNIFLGSTTIFKQLHLLQLRDILYTFGKQDGNLSVEFTLKHFLP